jgi:ubiquinone/menaquinone biosynthesis C-methylase UbiE
MARKTNKSVFELYAHEYDIITSADQRVKSHQKEVDAIIERFAPQSVLDAGCATGLTAMLFAGRGVWAVGLDRSRPMLAEARKKYADLGLPLEFRYGHFEQLPESLCGRFDAVVCLANSISGVGSLRNLHKAFQNFLAALTPGGVLVLQMLNYASMKEGTLFPIKATETKGIVYERFSERRGRTVAIYVTRLDLTQRQPSLEVFRHEFDNFTADEVSAGLKRAQFKNIRRYSNLTLTKRYSRQARDLVITAEKP